MATKGKRIKLSINGRELKCKLSDLKIDVEEFEVKPIKIKLIPKQKITVEWSDGDVTAATCDKNDEFNEDIGILVALLKKFMPTSDIIYNMELVKNIDNKNEEKTNKKQTKDKTQEELVEEKFDEMLKHFFGFDQSILDKMKELEKERNERIKKQKASDDTVSLFDLLFGI